MEKTISYEIRESYGLQLYGIWKLPSLTIVDQACKDIFTAFQLPAPTNIKWLKETRVMLEEMKYGGLTSDRLVKLNPTGLTTWTVVHELAHAWDFFSLNLLSLKLSLVTHSYGPTPFMHDLHPLEKRYWYRVGSPPPPCGVNQHFNRLEDFAESVTAFVYPEIAHERATANGNPYEMFGYSNFHETPRGRFIESLKIRAQKKEMASTK